jgi:hypothetical protein
MFLFRARPENAQCGHHSRPVSLAGRLERGEELWIAANLGLVGAGRSPVGPSHALSASSIGEDGSRSPGTSAVAIARPERPAGRGPSAPRRGSTTRWARLADPRRMTPEEQEQAHGLLTRVAAIRPGGLPARPSTT